jgi:branched-chain amino acid transport system substrate-binding protein
LKNEATVYIVKNAQKPEISDISISTKIFNQNDMERDLYSEKLSVSSDNFVQQMHLLNRADNPKLVFQLVIKWTKGQPLLTKTLLQYVLESDQKIVMGREAITVEKIVRNRLIKDFKQDELTLLIRKLLYGKDLISLLRKTHGEVTDRERIYLANLQSELGLSDKQVQTIERQCVQTFTSSRIQITHQSKTSTSKERDDSENSYQDLILLIEKSPIYHQLNTELSLNPKPKKSNKTNFFVKNWWLCLLIPLLFLSVRNLGWQRNSQTTTAADVDFSETTCVNLTKNKSPRMSLGEKLLTKKYSYLEPSIQAILYEATAAFARCEYSLAQSKFEAALELKKNNPEALIYVNNAKAIAVENLKIAVSVPIGNQPEIAWEILRGVAQRQTEINLQGGINGKLLLVEIVSDDDNPDVASQIARQLAADSSVLAVIGHNDSNASLAASNIYQEQKLVMISATSSGSKLSDIGSYILRTTPSVSILANALSSYASVSSLDRIAVCFDSSSSASNSFAQKFMAETTENGGQILPIDCDFARLNFNPVPIVEKAIALEADAILLSPSVNKINLAVAIAQVNQNRLSLLGSYSLYTSETIDTGQEAVAEMVLSVPWLPETTPNSVFLDNSREFWGGKVNWRTAMAYDATKAIAKGLENSDSRTELQSILTNSDFLVEGATGQFRFEKGDRLGKVHLAHITKPEANSNRYEFLKLNINK